MAKPWEPAFPQLGSYEDHSLPTRRYNCWAFAAGENLKRWEPDPGGQYYWPPNVQRDYTVPAFIAAYETLGYKTCADASLHPAFEKISIYTLVDGRVTHAARQLSDGRWISKLGHEEDIIHSTPEALNGKDYGAVVRYMKRPRS